MLFGQHSEAVTGLSWGPSTEPALLNVETGSGKADMNSFSLPPKRLVSCGNDHQVHVWEFRESDQAEQRAVGSHNDQVRDVAWCNNIGLLEDIVASCSNDNTVKIWKKSADPSKGKGVEWQLAQTI